MDINMKRAVGLLILSILAWAYAPSGQDLTRDSVAAEIQRHFASPKPEFAFLDEVTGESDLTRLVNAFFKDNFLYVDWLSRESKDYREGLNDSVCAFLEARGQKISGVTMKPKTRVSLNELKAVAVRNIYPLRVTAEGGIGTLVCASALGYKDFPDRNVAVEAFAFQTIFNEMKNKDSFIMARIHDYKELAKSLKLSTNPDDLLKRAQGVYWGLLYQNADFEKMLIQAYREKARILPFEVSPL